MKENHRDIYNKIQFTEMTNNDVRKQQSTPQEISDWLLDSDIHFILSHIHQGILAPKYFDWTPQLIDQNFFRLKNHRGFPNGICLKCPIFLQDKFQYLSAISSKCLPTLKVSMSIDVDSLETQAKIKQ